MWITNKVNKNYYFDTIPLNFVKYFLKWYWQNFSSEISKNRSTRKPNYHEIDFKRWCWLWFAFIKLHRAADSTSSHLIEILKYFKMNCISVFCKYKSFRNFLQNLVSQKIPKLCLELSEKQNFQFRRLYCILTQYLEYSLSIGIKIFRKFQN